MVSLALFNSCVNSLLTIEPPIATTAAAGIMSTIKETLVTENLTTSFVDIKENNYQVWLFSILAASLVGLTGVLPMFVIPFQLENSKDKQKSQSNLKLMLSFAVGGLLGDVFLHLLPEAWGYVFRNQSSPHENLSLLGFWVLFGISTFVTVERLAVNVSNNIASSQSGSLCSTEKPQVNGHTNLNGSTHSNGQYYSNSKDYNDNKQMMCVTGYLNLVANSVDNFTHGLAVGASFLVGIKIGLLTTIAIIAHEVPHEFGDFAILMKSGFSKWEAVKAQISTASVGILGAIVALSADSAQAVGVKTAWILPFTAGGFLHVAMVSILPDLLKEDNPWESVKQLICITAGIASMALVNILTE